VISKRRVSACGGVAIVRRHRRVREYQALPHSGDRGEEAPRGSSFWTRSRRPSPEAADLSGVKSELTGTVLA
jgi:hypothetical protein